MRRIAVAGFLFLSLACGRTQEQTELKVSNLNTVYIDPSAAVYLAPNFQTFVTSTLTAHDNAIIGPAAQAMHQRLDTAAERANIVNCTSAAATNNIPNIATFTSNLAYVFQNPSRPIKIYVARIFNEVTTPSFVAGRAPVGNGGAAASATCTNGTFPECGDLMRIAVNTDYIGSDSAANFSNSNNINVWAGILAHEVGHNLGLNHGAPDTGSFVRAFGDCVAAATGFPLGGAPGATTLPYTM